MLQCVAGMSSWIDSFPSSPHTEQGLFTKMARQLSAENQELEDGPDARTSKTEDYSYSGGSPRDIGICLWFLVGNKRVVVLTAVSGADGLAESGTYNGEIALLLSDFQMPGMNGMELATAITLERPEIRVLLMSGFPTGMLVLNEGWHFLAKPFVPS